MKLEKTIPFQGYFDRGILDRSVNKVVIVIGCGGTGGYLIPDLARYVALLSRLRRGNMGFAKPDDISLVLVDGDEVEDKNLVRQNFVRGDLGKFKAEVMAKRYAGAFGKDIAYFPGFLEDIQDINRLVVSQSFNAKPIIVTCVDNNKTRQLVMKWFEKRPDHLETFWIDAGNEQFNGQVVVGYKGTARMPLDEIEAVKTRQEAEKFQPFQLPHFFQMFPGAFGDMGMLPSEERNALNCAEAALQNPQSITANMMSAQALFNVLQAILKHEPLGYHAVYFQGNGNRMSPVRLTETQLQKANAMITDYKATLLELDLHKVAYPRRRRRAQAPVEQAREEAQGTPPETSAQGAEDPSDPDGSQEVSGPAAATLHSSDQVLDVEMDEVGPEPELQM